MVDDRRVDEHEELLTAWRPALLHQLEGTLGQAFGELTRVRNRRDEHRKTGSDP
jgi:hypothetical protein